MLKKVIGTKGIFLLAGLIMVVSLSGCAGGLAEQGSTGMIIHEEEPSKDQETEYAEQISTDNVSNSAETSVVLTDKGKVFLAQICNELNDFNSGQAMDEKFWHGFLFNSYTCGTSENAVTEQVYREDLGFEETVIKVSLQEVQERVKLVFGIELPDFKPSFEDTEKGQTSFYYTWRLI